jgi:phosphate transport system permease protein
MSERVFEASLKVVAGMSILAVAGILLFVLKEALPVLTSELVRCEVTVGGMLLPDEHAGFVWRPVSHAPVYNIVPLVVGTLKVSLAALALSVPLSVGAAVFVSELAGRRAREIIKPLIELLAGVPSVAVGFFVLVVLSTWVQRALGTEHRLNALVAGMGLAFTVCPIVFSVSDDAIRAVPASFRDAAFALGATRSQALVRVILPAAMPGIGGAVVLGFGRAVGETMIVLLSSGNAALVDASWGRSVRTITATIAQELGEVAFGSPHYHALFALGAILFAATLALNRLGASIARRTRGAVWEDR